jgi:hypothetical protein
MKPARLQAGVCALLFSGLLLCLPGCGGKGGGGTDRDAAVSDAQADDGAAQQDGDTTADGGVDGGGGGDGGGACTPAPDIVVQPSNRRFFFHSDGSPFFVCGPGDPEGFLYRGTRNADGTRTGDQMDLINKLAATGANSIYFQAVRSHGGDGVSDHNPFIDSNEANGLDDDILDQWETWFTALDNAGIVQFFFIYDDSACIWGCANQDSVPAEEDAFVTALVDRFEHHRLLVWVVAEEYQERFTATRVSNIAAVIRAADDCAHPIAVHKLSGLNFDEFATDPNIDQFAIQYNQSDPDTIHNGMVQAFADAAGRYNLNMSEAAGHGTGATARLKNWAVALGGAYVMVLGWDIDTTDASDLQDCGRLVNFMESTRFDTMEPRDDLAFGATQYVLANPADTFILYASARAGDMGVRAIDPGTYDLTWLDAATGAMVDQNDVTVSGGDVTWTTPGGIGAETAVYVRRSTP